MTEAKQAAAVADDTNIADIIVMAYEDIAMTTEDLVSHLPLAPSVDKYRDVIADIHGQQLKLAKRRALEAIEVYRTASGRR
jgi:hypothetical protein